MSAGPSRFRSMLKSKIHRARVTHANVDYEGSLSIDPVLLKAADILPGEEVQVWNVTRAPGFRPTPSRAPRVSGK